MVRAVVFIFALIVALAGASAPAVRAQEPPRSDGWVVIPIEDYRALRLKAYPPEPPPEPPPMPFAVSRVDYDLRAATDAFVGEVRITVDILSDKWTLVPIPTGFLSRGVRVDGRPVSFVDHGVLFSKRGRSVITLDIAIPMRLLGSTESLMLPPMMTFAPVTRAALILPRRDIDMTVTGGVLVERPADPEKPWVAFGSPGGITFTWKKQAGDGGRAQQPTRIRSHITQSIGLGEDTALVTANVNVDVTQGLASSIDLALPKSLLINQVSGPLVGDWEFKPGALRVAFLEPLSAQTTLSISAEAPVPREGQIDIPLMRLTGGERETGGVAVEVLGAGEITERQPRGLDPADPSDLGGDFATRATPSTIAYRFRPQEANGDRQLAVKVLRYTPQAVLIANIEEARYDALVGEEGKVLVRARYAVRNNQRAFLGLTLPQGATLWSATVAARQLRPGEAPGGGLLIPLLKGRTGEESPAFVVEIAYVQRADAWSDSGKATLTLPTLDVPVSQTGLTVHYSPRFRLKPEPGAFRPDTDNGVISEALRSADAPLAVEGSTAGGYTGTGQGTGGGAGMGQGTGGAYRQLPGGILGGPVGTSPAPSAPVAEGVRGSSKDESGKLISDFRQRYAGRAVAGVVPVQIRFPEFGERLFLASELTPEGRPASVEISYKREERW